MPDKENHKNTLKIISEIGGQLRSNQKVLDTQLIELNNHDKVNRLGPNIELLIADFSNDELTDLIYGMTYTERKLRWMGGSAASAIFLFRILEKRNFTMEELDVVSAWIIRNSNNKYNPFGSFRSHDVENYSAYLDLRKKISVAGEIYITAVKEKEWLEHSSKKLLTKVKTPGWTLENSPGRKKLYDDLSELSIFQQLTRMSEDKTYPPEFYPIELARNAMPDEIKALPIDVKEKIYKKMSGNYVGPWEVFRKKLKEELALFNHTKN